MGEIYIASRGLVFNNLVISMNSVRLVQYENYQRREKNRSRLQRDPRFDHDLAVER
jgi:hypothetical protein